MFSACTSLVQVQILSLSLFMDESRNRTQFRIKEVVPYGEWAIMVVLWVLNEWID